MYRFFPWLVFLTASTASAEEIHQQQLADQLLIEAEATKSPLGNWVRKTSVDGYQGEAHLEFTGNAPDKGPPDSPLAYRFRVREDGIYTLRISAHKRLEGARKDYCNDCYVRLEGNFESGNAVPKAILAQDTKLYVHGTSAESWDWAHMLDYVHPETGEHEKREAVYKLKAGEIYTLVISGRSQRFNMDRISLRY